MNYFIIHGSYGNPYKNWIPWLKSQLSKRKLNCIVPNFPSPEKQNYECWKKVLEAYLEIGCITEDTTFVTHSLGGIFIAKFLLEHQVKIKKIITVAGFNNIKFDEENELYNSFYIAKEELKKVQECCLERVSLYSNNDPYVPMLDAEEFANELQAKKVLIKDAGHFNEKFGYNEFREILEFI